MLLLSLYGQVVAISPVIVAAKVGLLSIVRKLLDGGAATVGDQDEVSALCTVYMCCVIGLCDNGKNVITIFSDILTKLSRYSILSRL